MVDAIDRAMSGQSVRDIVITVRVHLTDLSAIVDELAGLRQRRDELQARMTELVKENRKLKFRPGF